MACASSVEKSVSVRESARSTIENRNGHTHIHGEVLVFLSVGSVSIIKRKSLVKVQEKPHSVFVYTH